MSESEAVGTATETDVENAATENEDTDVETDDTDDVFSRDDAEKLRDENAKLAQCAHELAHRLHTELVRATGRLADPADLEYSDAHLNDSNAMTAAIDALLDSKPHLQTRRIPPNTDVGQGKRGQNPPIGWEALRVR
jgi:hypothetical protein